MLALERYAEAARSSSEAGRAAQDAVVRLELPEQPENHLSLGTGLDGSGRLRVEIRNPTRLAVSGIVLAVRYRDTGGAVREVRRGLNATLAPGTARVVETGLGPFASADEYDVGIVTAQGTAP